MIAWLFAAALAAPTVDELQDALSSRHAPACHELGDLADEALVEALVEVAETVMMPPWVGPHAAACAVTATANGPALRAAHRWVAAPEHLGLAVVALDHLDALGEPAAISLARAAWQGAKSDDRRRRLVRTRLSRSTHASVRALLP